MAFNTPEQGCKLKGILVIIYILVYTGLLPMQVLVMTPQILLHNLSHCFIKIEMIALLIFDECHYAQLDSNHDYAEIMKVNMKSLFIPAYVMSKFRLLPHFWVWELPWKFCRSSTKRMPWNFLVFLAWLHLQNQEKVIDLCLFLA